MAEDIIDELSFELAYDGPAIEGSAMDVLDLAPAMMALGELCNEINEVFNHGRANVELMVEANFEKGSFLIKFKAFQSISDKFRSLFDDSQIKKLAELLNHAGIITKDASSNLLDFLKQLGPKKIVSTNPIEGDNNTIIQVFVMGDQNPIETTEEVWRMASSGSVRHAAKRLIGPVEQEGYDKLVLSEKGKNVRELTKEDVKQITEACSTGTKFDIENMRETHETWISPQRVDFDPNAEKWRFIWHDKTIDADITETPIGTRTEDRGFVSLEDRHKVLLEVEPYETEKGRIRYRYKILKELEFRPGIRQPTLFPVDPER